MHALPQARRRQADGVSRCRRIQRAGRAGIGQVLGHADRPHARAAAAVGDAEGFVQIQVADIRADSRRAGEADLRVHVRAIHVDLPAVIVDDAADLADGFFEHAVRGRIGDHRGRRGCRHVPRLWRAGRPCRCCRARSHCTATTSMPGDDALAGLVPWAVMGMRQTLRWCLRGFVIAADGEQAGVFALRAGVGLQRDRGEAGDFREPVFQCARTARRSLAPDLSARRDACRRSPAR